MELLAEGRRAMACQEFMTASMAFQEACEIMSATHSISNITVVNVIFFLLQRVTKHGQVADVLAEPYFLYGKSLLELAR